MIEAIKVSYAIYSNMISLNKKYSRKFIQNYLTNHESIGKVWCFIVTRVFYTQKNSNY